MKIDHNHTLERDQYQWILTTWKDSKGRKGQPIRVPSCKYFSTLEQVASHLTAECAEGAATVQELVVRFSTCSYTIAQALREAAAEQSFGQQNGEAPV